MEVVDKTNQLCEISRKLLLEDSFTVDIGLFEGKMGMAIFFFHYAGFLKSDDYSNFSMMLLDEIYEDISQKNPLGFSKGLCGIAWGILYLLQQNFAEGDPNEILEEVDRLLLDGLYSKNYEIDSDINSLGEINYMINRNFFNYFVLNQTDRKLHNRIGELKEKCGLIYEDTDSFLQRIISYLKQTKDLTCTPIKYNEYLFNGLEILLDNKK